MCKNKCIFLSKIDSLWLRGCTSFLLWISLFSDKLRWIIKSMIYDKDYNQGDTPYPSPHNQGQAGNRRRSGELSHCICLFKRPLLRNRHRVLENKMGLSESRRGRPLGYAACHRRDARTIDGQLPNDCRWGRLRLATRLLLVGNEITARQPWGYCSILVWSFITKKSPSLTFSSETPL